MLKKASTCLLLLTPFFTGHLYTTDAYFTDITASAGLSTTSNASVGGLGPGAAWGDYDGDGDQDLYVATSEGIPNYLYRNNGDGTFTDVAAPAGVADTDNTHGVYFIDYDNDGDRDLYLAKATGEMDQVPTTPNTLYQNNGDGTFTDVTSVAGVDAVVGVGSSTSAAWGDYDNDGNIDLYVVNFWRSYGEANVLYRNNGDGTFTDVTAIVGGGVGDAGWGLATAWGDVNNDNYLDLYLANDGGDLLGYNSKIFLNNGDGTFVDGSAFCGLMDALGMMDGNEMGIAYSDVNKDGWLDFYVTNGIWFDEFNNMLFHNWLYMNNGDGTFTETAEAAGVEGLDPTGNCTGWSTDIFDYNNDGEQDIYFANGNIMPPDPYYDMLYRNNGDGTFSDVTLTSGTAEFDLNRGAAFGDFDRNGFVDILTTANQGHARLYKNEGNANNFLSVTAVGTLSNRDGIGARVWVKKDSLSQMEEISGGSGYMSMNDLPAEFGMGVSIRVDTLRVVWPASGLVDVATDVYLNQSVTVTEGEGITYDDPFNVLIESLTPAVTPGGEFILGATLTNNLSTTVVVEINTEIVLANGASMPMVTSKFIQLGPNDVKSGTFTYSIPLNIPLGETTYSVTANDLSFTDTDRIEFTVVTGD